VERVAILLILGLVIGVFWFALRPRYVFVIAIVKGEPRLTQGKVTRAMLQQVGEICAEYGVERGWVGGILRGRKVSLTFSSRIQPRCRQRLRNLWLASG
jgi:hypothetical protein